MGRQRQGILAGFGVQGPSGVAAQLLLGPPWPEDIEPDLAASQSHGLTNRRMRARMSGCVGGGGATPPPTRSGSGCREYSYGGFGGGHPHFLLHAPDLLIGRSGHIVQDRLLWRCAGQTFHSCPHGTRFVRRPCNRVGYSHGAQALILDRLLMSAGHIPSSAPIMRELCAVDGWCCLPVVAAVAVTVAVRQRSGPHPIRGQGVDSPCDRRRVAGDGPLVRRAAVTGEVVGRISLCGRLRRC